MADGVEIGMLEMLQIVSDDVGSTLAFYRDVLGATVQTASPHWSQVRLGGVDIGIHPAPVSYDGWIPAFRVADIAAVRGAVLAAGLECLEPHDIPGGVTLQFRDPAQNWLSCVQYGITVAALNAAP